MKTKLFTGLAFAAALLSVEPAFAAHSDRQPAKGRGGHTVAVIHHGGGSHAVAVVHRGSSSGHRPATTSGGSRYNGGTLASSRSSGSRHSVAFGGSAYNSGGSSNNSSGGHYEYAFQSHEGWSHDREYTWHGHHYRWFNNGWFIIDPFQYPVYGAPYYAGSPVSVEVQQVLARDGYYQGPIDGIVGPGTQAAIAAYQRDNGFGVTGTINGRLLNSLGLD